MRAIPATGVYRVTERRPPCLISHMRWLLLLLALAAAPVLADTLEGRVVGVADGDTLTVLDGAKRQHMVRLAGIDAPEKGQPFGNQAKQSFAALAAGLRRGARSIPARRSATQRPDHGADKAI